MSEEANVDPVPFTVAWQVSGVKQVHALDFDEAAVLMEAALRRFLGDEGIVVDEVVLSGGETNDGV
jgi:hypothetical protein